MMIPKNTPNTASTALAIQGQSPLNSGSPLTILNMSSEQVGRIKLLAEMYAASTFNRSGQPLGQGDYFLIMLKGIELGISPMSAVGIISIIQGVPVLDAKGILALVKGSGLLEDIEMGGDETAYYCIMKRKGESSAHKEIFTIEDAANLGLASKSNYKKQPKTMLKWRVVTACARVVFPDITIDLYTHEEIDPDNTRVLEDGSMTTHETVENSSETDMPQFANKGGNGKRSAVTDGEQFTDDITHVGTHLTERGQRYYMFAGLMLWTRQPFRELFNDPETTGFDVVLEEVGSHALPDPLRAAYHIEYYEGDMGEQASRRKLLRLHRIKTGQTVDVKARPADSVTEDTIAGGVADDFKYDKRTVVAWDSLSVSEQDTLTEEEFWSAAHLCLNQDPSLTPDLLVEAIRVALS